ncbi:MAG: CotH kinase family protein [Saprospirales bacterium]|nr:CotH kinase family protein [Saprospirales bacterium]
MSKTFCVLLLLLGIARIAHAQAPLPDEQPLVVRFSLAGGFYDQDLQVALDAGNAAIYYTTDGSYPTARSARYSRPIALERSTVLRAIARRGKISGRAFAQSYFIREPHTGLPVISLAVNPGILFHPQYGIMMDGPAADSAAVHKPGANFWTRREFACHVEIFESDKTCVHNSGSGMRLFGGYSRIYPQKSLVLVARDRYGKKFFRHRIFGAGQPKKYKYLVLRNGGSDFDGAHFRDELMNRLTEGWDIEKQAFRPALLYLNGRYWGIYHIREKINARFLEDHADVDRDSLDLLEHQRNVRHGSGRHYHRLLKYIREHNLAEPAHYAWVQSQMDVNNYIDYQVAQIYCDNTDAGGNIRYWRPRRPGGRWRWVLFDIDWGFGLYNPLAWQHDAIGFFTEPDGPRWPNPPWSTFLLRSLLQNADFRQQFINRLCDRLNTSFSTGRVLAEIDWFERTLGPDMPRHLQRWRRSEAVWQRQLAVLREFAEKRPGFLRASLPHYFNTGAPAGLELEVGAGGAVLLNHTASIGLGTFRGMYFEKIPITLTAIPAFGYRFAGWEGIDRQGRHIQTYLPGGNILRLRARFEQHMHPLSDQVIFNEIAMSGSKTGDWIELYNTSKKPLRLAGWTLTDHRREWTFPDVHIPPKGYLVVCQDTAAFRRKYPRVALVAGDFRFGLDKNADRLALYASDGGAVDSIAYHLDPPEGAFTLDLLMPGLDNADAASWAVHAGPGSPGAPNPLYWSKVLAEKKDRSLRLGLAIGLLILALGVVYLRNRKR